MVLKSRGRCWLRGRRAGLHRSYIGLARIAWACHRLAYAFDGSLLGRFSVWCALRSGEKCAHSGQVSGCVNPRAGRLGTDVHSDAVAVPQGAQLF